MSLVVIAIKLRYSNTLSAWETIVVASPSFLIFFAQGTRNYLMPRNCHRFVSHQRVMYVVFQVNDGYQVKTWFQEVVYTNYNFLGRFGST